MLHGGDNAFKSHRLQKKISASHGKPPFKLMVRSQETTYKTKAIAVALCCLPELERAYCQRHHMILI